jgi:cytochrome c-type biogenesis protein CcmH/NrfG
MIEPPRPQDIARVHAALPPVVGDPRAFVAAARTALGDGKLEDAMSLARAALTLAPTNASGWVVVGDVCAAGNDPGGARDAWQEALSLDDKDHATALACARVQLQLGDVASARALLNYLVARTTTVSVRAAAEALLDSERAE